jgi:hypothetical protein
MWFTHNQTFCDCGVVNGFKVVDLLLHVANGGPFVSDLLLLVHRPFVELLRLFGHAQGKTPPHLWHSVRTGQLIWIHFDIHAIALVTEMQAKSCHSGWLQLPKQTCYTTFIHENVDTCPSKFTQFHLAFMIKVPIISPFQCLKLNFLKGFQPHFVAQQRSPRRSGAPRPWAARCDWSPEKRWVNSAWPLGRRRRMGICSC